MNIFILILFCLLLFILIIVLPFKIKANLHINYQTYEMYYLINLWIINFICGKINLLSSNIIENKNNHITGDGKNKKYSSFLIKEYLKRITVANIDIYKIYGNSSDAMNTSLFCAIDNLIFNILNSYIYTKNRMLNTYVLVEPNYNEDINQTSIYGVIKISILDVILSIIKAKLKVKSLNSGKEKE